jgi:hypothetical protein
MEYKKNYNINITTEKSRSQRLAGHKKYMRPKGKKMHTKVCSQHLKE